MSWLGEVLDKVDRYLIGTLDDRDLESWVVSNLQLVLESGDATAIRLINEVDALFVEVGEGIIDPTTLHNRLGALAQQARTRPSYATREQIIKALAEYGYRLTGEVSGFVIFEHSNSPHISLVDMSMGISFTDLLGQLNETQLDLDDFVTRLALAQVATSRS